MSEIANKSSLKSSKMGHDTSFPQLRFTYCPTIPLHPQESSSSSSSDSSEEDEPRDMKRGMTEKKDMKQDRKSQQLQQLMSDSAQNTPPTPSPLSPSITTTTNTSRPISEVMQSPFASSSFSSLLQQQRLEDSLDLTADGVLGSSSSSQPRVSSAYLPSQPMLTAAPARILVCTGSKCANRGADDVLEAVSDARSAAGSNAEIVPCKCLVSS